MELSEQEKNAIESVKSMFGDITIEELIKDKDFKTTIYSLGILDILLVIAIVDKLQKETEREKQYSDFYEDLCNKQQEIMKELQKDKKVLIKNYDKVLGTFICKDKIRDYFAHAIAFKGRLIRENEEISDYNRGKFDTIEDLLERLEDNKWN